MKTFFAELRKRRVVKVGIAYLVAAWVVLQLADVILPAMNLPEWTITLVLILLAAGFPIALILSWIFDITPDGIEKTGEVEAKDTGRALDPDEVSIAVLPFPDLSAEQDQEHFCDGLTEELLNVLIGISGLRVASRTSSFAFKGRKASLEEVAGKLQVDYVLEGSVRKAGNTVRISAQLIRVESDTNLWSETWDRELCDIFEIQDDIAARVLRALRLKLGKAAMPDPTTTDAKAYEYFLRARGLKLINSKQSMQQASDLLQKALAIDPEFTRAWVALAETNAIRSIFFGGGAATQELADQASTAAMELSPQRADSHFARGVAQVACQCYDEAEAEFLKALELDPESVRAWHWLARAAHQQGETQREQEYFTRATELDPEDWESPVLGMSSYLDSGDDDGATRLAKIAVERITALLEDYPDMPRALYLGTGALYQLGRLDEAMEWGNRAIELAPDDPATRYNMACFYARLGEPEKALDLLDNSITSRSWIENDKDLNSLHSHPRYRQIIDSLCE